MSKEKIQSLLAQTKEWKVKQLQQIEQFPKNTLVSTGKELHILEELRFFNVCDLWEWQRQICINPKWGKIRSFYHNDPEKALYDPFYLVIARIISDGKTPDEAVDQVLFELENNEGPSYPEYNEEFI